MTFRNCGFGASYSHEPSRLTSLDEGGEVRGDGGGGGEWGGDEAMVHNEWS